jgi:serine/threonine protein kinase
MSTSSPPDDSVAEFVRSLFFQLLEALKIARETVQFAHLDLNLENILFDRRFTIPVPYMDSRDPYYATGGAKIKIIDYGVSGVTLVRGQPIVSESPFKSEYGSFDFDFWRIYQKLKLRMGQDWWDAIDQETGGKFNELSKIASTAKADPNFYSVILQAPLFAKFL